MQFKLLIIFNFDVLSFFLRLMQQNITDKNSEAFQRLAWEALKKSINGLINKVTDGPVC